MWSLLPMHCKSVGLRRWDSSPGCQGSAASVLEKPPHVLVNSQMAGLLHASDKIESKKGWNMLFMLEVENPSRKPQTNHFSFPKGSGEEIPKISQSIYGGNILCLVCLGDKS